MEMSATLDHGQELQSDFQYVVSYGLGSVLVYFLIFRFLSPFLSDRLTTSYSGLSRDDQSEWHGRVLSTIHALLCDGLASYCLLTEEGLSDRIWYDCKLARISVSCTMGYLLADQFRITMMSKLGPGELLLFTAHHLVSVYAYYFVSVNGILCYFAMYRMLCEFSNPFLNMRWFLLTTNTPKTSKGSVINGVGLFVSFFLCRVVTIPKFWYNMWSVFQLDSVRVLGHIQYTVMIIPSLILDTLNLYWFYKICRVAYQLLTKGTSSRDKTKEH